MKIEENAVYTTTELAELLKVSLPTIKRMLKDGRLKSTRIGRQHRFLGSDILEIFEGKKDLRKDSEHEGPEPVHPGGEKQTGSSGPHAKPGAPVRPQPTVEISQIEKRQRAYMIGKEVASPLMADDGTVLFDRGVIVNESIMDRAKKEKKLMELFACISHET